MIAPAFEVDMSTSASKAACSARSSMTPQREALVHAIRNRGIDYVAQEAVTLSSMPVWRDGRLQPRPFTLRIFLTKVAGRWQACPEASSASPTRPTRAPSVWSAALATADAWLLARAGRSVETRCCRAAERIEVQRASGILPSRAADNLFWVGRYVERAEATLRLVRAMTNRAAEADRDRRRRCSRRWAAARGVERGPDDAGGARTRLPDARGADQGPAVGRAARAHRRGARAQLGDPRPLLAGCLARDPRPRHHHRDAARVRERKRKRHHRAGRGGLTHHLFALGARAGEHDAACRLALPRTRPAHRARHPHRPVDSDVSRCRGRPRAASTSCSNSPTARSPIGSAT